MESEDDEEELTSAQKKYNFTEEQKEDFEEVRSGAKGRAAVFVPELLLVRQRKRLEEKKKAATRPTADVFSEAAYKLYPDSDSKRKQVLEYAVNANLRNMEDLDPHVLIVAADLKLTYPDGLNIEGFPDRRKLSYEVMSSEAINRLAIAILEIQGSAMDRLERVKIDIISYYTMFGY